VIGEELNKKAEDQQQQIETQKSINEDLKSKIAEMLKHIEALEKK
jgi:cell division protein FtsL